MAGLLPEAGSGGGHGCRPLLCRPRHAENFGGIERDEGYDKPQLARIVRRRRLQPVKQQRVRLWLTSRYAACDGLWRERR